jgi:hypothetical protein
MLSRTSMHNTSDHFSSICAICWNGPCEHAGKNIDANLHPGTAADGLR